MAYTTPLEDWEDWEEYLGHSKLQQAIAAKRPASDRPAGFLLYLDLVDCLAWEALLLGRPVRKRWELRSASVVVWAALTVLLVTLGRLSLHPWPV
jgi:hypothetical protein